MDNYTAFNFWANKRLVNWLKVQSEHLLQQEFPSSYPSILKTLNHIWGVEEFWFSIITETVDYKNRFDAADFISSEIFDGLLARSHILSETVKVYSDEEIIKLIKPTDPDLQRELPRYEFLQHLVNHSSYHRGQVITIARGVGIANAPMTDYNVYHDPV